MNKEFNNKLTALAIVLVQACCTGNAVANTQRLFHTPSKSFERISPHTSAQSDPKTSQWPVMVSVSTNDDDLRYTISSQVKREVRGLRDCVVTDIGVPSFTISINALKVFDEADHLTGYSMSVLIYQNDKDAFSGLKLTEKDWENEVRKTGRIIIYELKVGPMNTLVDTCREIVEKFDSTWLDGMRKAKEKLRSKRQ